MNGLDIQPELILAVICYAGLSQAAPGSSAWVIPHMSELRRYVSGDSLASRLWRDQIQTARNFIRGNGVCFQRGEPRDKLVDVCHRIVTSHLGHFLDDVALGVVRMHQSSVLACFHSLMQPVEYGNGWESALVHSIGLEALSRSPGEVQNVDVEWRSGYERLLADRIVEEAANSLVFQGTGLTLRMVERHRESSPDHMLSYCELSEWVQAFNSETPVIPSFARSRLGGPGGSAGLVWSTPGRFFSAWYTEIDRCNTAPDVFTWGQLTIALIQCSVISRWVEANSRSESEGV